MRKLGKQLNYPFILSILLVGCIFFINPIGDFPLNDDWSYALNTKSLVEDHEIFFHDWGAMTLFAHNIWGACFCKLFGFSFTTLRISTLFLAWIGIVVTFYFLHEAGIEKKYAFCLTLLLQFNPFFFSLAFSYMTEVPFLTFVMLGAYFFQKNMNEENSINLVWGTLFSVVATLIRQPGILVPLAFGVVFIIKNKNSLTAVYQSITPAACTIGTLAIFTNWRANNFGLSSNFGRPEQLFANFTNGKFSFALAEMSEGIFKFWGLFLLPLLIFSLSFLLQKKGWRLKAISFVITLLAVFPFTDQWQHGFHGNVFYNLGMGPITIANDPQTFAAPLSESHFTTVKLVGFIAGVILLLWIWLRGIQIILFFIKRKSDAVNWATVFSFAMALGYFIFLLANNFFFGRYYLIPLPFLMVLIFPKSKPIYVPKWILPPTAITFIVIALFSLSSTKDYLNWNRTRKAAMDFLTKELQIPIDKINGGFEWNGWYGTGRTKPSGWDTKAWLTSSQEAYTLGFQEMSAYEKIKTFSFQRIIAAEQNQIFVLKRKAPSMLQTINCDLEKINSDTTVFISDQAGVEFQNVAARTTEKVRSGRYGVKLNQENPYGLTLQFTDIQPGERIWYHIWRYPASSSATLVAAAQNIEDFYELESQNIIATDDAGWGLLTKDFVVPLTFPDSVLNFYIFHPQPESVYLDDVEITRCQY